jgi:dihydroflavonol-4-reductase
MRTFVTGGSGVVGGAVIRHLVAEGHRVRALARSSEAAHEVADMGAEPVPGALSDRAALADGMTGAEVAFHVAGVNEMCVKDPGWMFRVNVDGTRRLLEVADDVGIPRVVVTSSAAALGEERGTIGTEASEHRGWFLSEYERSKYLQERAALEHRGPTEVVCVNPSSVQGPGRATGTGRIILDVLGGRIPVLPDAPLSMIDIDDCAAGHLLAAEHGAPGQRYVLNGFTMTTREAVALLSRRTGLDPKTRFLPEWVTRAIAAGTTGVERFMTLPEPICAEMVRTMAFGHTYDGGRARTGLGLVYRPAEVTFERLVAWFRAEGLLDR